MEIQYHFCWALTNIDVFFWIATENETFNQSFVDEQYKLQYKKMIYRLLNVSIKYLPKNNML